VGPKYLNVNASVIFLGRLLNVNNTTKACRTHSDLLSIETHSTSNSIIIIVIIIMCSIFVLVVIRL